VDWINLARLGQCLANKPPGCIKLGLDGSYWLLKMNPLEFFNP